MQRAIPTAGGKHCVMLLNPDAAPARRVFENLICIDVAGNVVWKAKLPSMPDMFVEVSTTNDGLWANSFSCWKMWLDPDTGAILRSEFTK